VLTGHRVPWARKPGDLDCDLSAPAASGREREVRATAGGAVTTFGAQGFSCRPCHLNPLWHGHPVRGDNRARPDDTGSERALAQQARLHSGVPGLQTPDRPSFFPTLRPPRPLKNVGAKTLRADSSALLPALPGNLLCSHLPFRCSILQGPCGRKVPEHVLNYLGSFSGPEPPR
jgi:hypothetical protein